MPGPVFMRGERVTLHPVEDDDEDLRFLQELVNHPDVRRNIALTEPASLADEREWLESHEGGTHFAVCAEPSDSESDTGDESTDRVPVGYVTFSEITEAWGTAEVAYFFHPDHWGNGYATDAVARLVEYGFAERRLEKVWARVFAFNDASKRVLEKVGFEREATVPDHAYIDGERVGFDRFALYADDWDERR